MADRAGDKSAAKYKQEIQQVRHQLSNFSLRNKPDYGDCLYKKCYSENYASWAEKPAIRKFHTLSFQFGNRHGGSFSLYSPLSGNQRMLHYLSRGWNKFLGTRWWSWRKCDMLSLHFSTDDVCSRGDGRAITGDPVARRADCARTSAGDGA